MANIQTQAYVICYFHVNAVLPVTMATGVIDRTGRGKTEKKEVSGFVFSFNIPNVVNPLAKR